MNTVACTEHWETKEFWYIGTWLEAKNRNENKLILSSKCNSTRKIKIKQVKNQQDEALTAHYFSTDLWVAKWMQANLKELPLVSPWTADQSSCHRYQILQEVQMHSSKTQVCWWNEGQDKLQFGEDGIVLVHHQNFLRHLQWQQLYQPNSLVVWMPSQ